MSKVITQAEIQTIKPDWNGNPTDAQGRFVNLEHPFTTSFKDVWKWQTGPKPHKQAKMNDHWKPGISSDTTFLNTDKDCIVWLGHAWFYLRIQGVTMLLDPVLFKIPFVKQISHNPYPPDIFKKIDLLLLSHDHRDHMDKKSITTLCANNPDMQIITGLNMRPMLRKWGNNSIVEMGWYQQLHWKEHGIKITYLPTRHWSRRYLTDTNLRLWGAFVIEAGDKTIYFGSDSGYGSHFKELGTLFPSLDLAMLGIGAFRPEWFMHQAHMSPWDAAKAFNDCGAKKLIPMHYGTLDLSDEPVGEPIQVIRQLIDENQINREVIIPNIGGSIYL